MTLKRYVIDTNVLVSAILLSQSRPQLAFDYALESGSLLVSSETLEELRTVLMRPKFARYHDLEVRMFFYEVFCQSVQIVNIIQAVTECRDPKDDKFLEVAVNGDADMIISGDSDLLVLNPFREIEIISVNEFLSRFES